MKSDKLTEVERRFALDALPGEDLTSPKDRTFLRGMMRRVAYHESGHVVARMFTGHEAGHIVRVSIMPDGINLGRETSMRNIAEMYLEEYPPALKLCAGRSLLLTMLAGRGAEMRVTEPEERVDILDEDALWFEGEEEGTDLFRALRVADIMARPYMPARRVLALAERWTIELLAVPDVWQAVERLAGGLIERGALDDRDEIRDACKGILRLGLKLPKWKRRLCLTKAQVREIKAKSREATSRAAR